MVHDFGPHLFVYFNTSFILNDFTGAFLFEERKYVPGYVRNKQVKDLATLIMAMERQLR